MGLTTVHQIPDTHIHTHTHVITHHDKVITLSALPYYVISTDNNATQSRWSLSEQNKIRKRNL